MLKEKEYQYYLFEYQKWKREKIEKVILGKEKEINYSVKNNLNEIQEYLKEQILESELLNFELETEKKENQIFVIKEDKLIPIDKFFENIKEEVLNNEKEMNEFIKYFKENEFCTQTEEELKAEYNKNKFNELLIQYGKLDIVDFYEFPYLNEKKYIVDTNEKIIKGVNNNEK